MNARAEKLKNDAIAIIQKIHGDKTIPAHDAYQAVEEIAAAADGILESMQDDALQEDIEL